MPDPIPEPPMPLRALPKLGDADSDASTPITAAPQMMRRPRGR